MKTLMERAENVQTLWRVVLPTVAPPASLRFVDWCEAFSDTTLEYALVRTSKKLRKGGLVSETNEVVRYATGVMMHEVENSQRKLAQFIESSKKGKELI